MLRLPKHARTVFQQWWFRLTTAQRADFAKRAGTTNGVIKSNYMIPLEKPLEGHKEFKRPCRRQPKSSTMLRLAKASRGKVAYKHIRDHFYPL